VPCGASIPNICHGEPNFTKTWLGVSSCGYCQVFLICESALIHTRFSPRYLIHRNKVPVTLSMSEVPLWWQVFLICESALEHKQWFDALYYGTTVSTLAEYCSP